MEISDCKGLGYIQVHINLYPDLNEPHTPEEWRKAILLPERYQVEEVQREGEIFKIFVRSEDIPTHGEIPLLVLTHTRYADGSVALTSITLQQWDGEHWREISRQTMPLHALCATEIDE